MTFILSFGDELMKVAAEEVGPERPTGPTRYGLGQKPSASAEARKKRLRILKALRARRSAGSIFGPKYLGHARAPLSRPDPRISPQSAQGKLLQSRYRKAKAKLPVTSREVRKATYSPSFVDKARTMNTKLKTRMKMRSGPKAGAASVDRGIKAVGRGDREQLRKPNVTTPTPRVPKVNVPGKKTFRAYGGTLDTETHNPWKKY